MTTGILQFAPSLKQTNDGIWRADRLESVSYPDSGNLLCADVEEGSFWYNHRNRCLKHLIDRFPPVGPMLDIGGGNGVASVLFQQLGIETVLVEPGFHGVKMARERGVKTVIHASLKEAEIQPASFGGACLLDVLEHVEDDISFLKETAETLTANAPLYLTVPAHAWLFSDNDSALGHFRRYELADLVRRIESTDFSVVFKSYYFASLVWPVFFVRTLPSRLGLKRRITSQSKKDEHRSHGPLRRLIGRLLLSEERRFVAGKTMGFGASCLVVARRNAR